MSELTEKYKEAEKNLYSEWDDLNNIEPAIWGNQTILGHPREKPNMSETEGNKKLRNRRLLDFSFSVEMKDFIMRVQSNSLWLHWNLGPKYKWTIKPVCACVCSLWLFLLYLPGVSTGMMEDLNWIVVEPGSSWWQKGKRIYELHKKYQKAKRKQIIKHQLYIHFQILVLHSLASQHHHHHHQLLGDYTEPCKRVICISSINLHKNHFKQEFLSLFSFYRKGIEAQKNSVNCL